MRTRLLDDPAEAAALLRAGGLVAFPTETVYGLGANALDEGAVARIFVAKGRPSDNPLIVHVAHARDALHVAERMTADGERLAAAFWPGPLTLVLARRASVPAAVSAGLATVGVRVPGSALARAFLEACGLPVAAPSANRSGRPSPTTWEAVRDDLDGRIDAILRGPRAASGLESTVVDATGDVPLVLRPGAVTLEALRAVVPTVRAAEAGSDLLARSPGTRHRHYAPHARVVLAGPDVIPDAEPAAWIGLHAPARPGAFARLHVAPSVEAYAHEAFAFFRACDAAEIAVIVCEPPPPDGLGAALLDRLMRAAAG